MFSKIFAGFVMGIIVAILTTLIVGMGTGGGEGGGQRGLWGAMFGFIFMLVLALTAARGRYAWGRGLLLSGLLCFALPLAAIVFTGIIGATEVPKAGSEVARAGAAIGTALGGGFITIVSGLFGFFLGIIFLVCAFFTLRAPRTS